MSRSTLVRLRALSVAPIHHSVNEKLNTVLNHSQNPWKVKNEVGGLIEKHFR